MEWLRDCPAPAFQGETNRDLLAHAERLEAVLEACNADKEALREWRRDHEAAQEGPQ